MTDLDGGEAADTTAAGAERRGSRLPWRALAGGTALAVIAGAAGAYFAGPRYPSDISPEAGFGRDMSVHHAQAVEMATAVRDNTDNREIRTLALDIVLTQQNQIGRMQGWLIQWKLPALGNRPAMAWMADQVGHGGGHSGGGGHAVGVMPGMASAAELSGLRAERGKKAETQFLTLMIRHHRGGVEMAEAVLDRTDRADVRALAHSIVRGQQNEITTMQQMLRARGAPAA